MNLYVYILEYEYFIDFNVMLVFFWEQYDFVYGDWISGENLDGCYEYFVEFDILQSVQQNGFIYIYVYFIKSGFYLDFWQKVLYCWFVIVYMFWMINKYKCR